MYTNNFTDWVKERQSRVEATALAQLPKAEEKPEKLHEAMRYAVVGGGKRVRPLLIYAVGEMLGAEDRNLDLASLAIECVHSYSLIHDDMPCMDNDTLRHGKPTTHAAFGEAIAMLAGDALQPESFCLIVRTDLPAERKLRLIELLAEASSTRGMCGGQAIDLSVVGKTMNLEDLQQMHRMKTGALLKCAVLMGEACAPKLPHEEMIVEALTQYGEAIGLAFQIVDDILDVTADTAVLGKTAGKDAEEDKPTYVSVLGLEEAKTMARAQLSRALNALDRLPKDLKGRERLREIAEFIVSRGY